MMLLRQSFFFYLNILSGRQQPTSWFKRNSTALNLFHWHGSVKKRGSDGGSASSSWRWDQSWRRNHRVNVNTNKQINVDIFPQRRGWLILTCVSWSGGFVRGDADGDRVKAWRRHFKENQVKGLIYTWKTIEGNTQSQVLHLIVPVIYLLSPGCHHPFLNTVKSPHTSMIEAKVLQG